MFFTFGFLILVIAQATSFVYGSPVSSTGESINKLLPRAPATFTHPGVLLNRAQLDFIKSKVNARQQPWYDAYNAMLADTLASPTRSPSPYATVACGSSSMNPSTGCKPEREDALAAYANALAWYISGTQAYATKAISYMNAWASTLKAHTNSNAPLQSGWSAASWSRAAEIIRWSNAGWSSSDITKFENLLRNVYLPILLPGSNSNGNWELGKLSLFLMHLC